MSKAGPLTVLALLLATSAARATVPPRDPPQGSRMSFAPAPPGPWTRACSFRRPLCVHARRGASERGALPVLASAERAWDVLTGALSLPAPDPSVATGAVDAYMVDGAPELVRAEPVERDVRSAIDRASARLLVDARARPGCALDAAMARALARAIAWRAAPALDEGTAAAHAQLLAQLAAPCAPVPYEGGEEFQSHLERALPDAWPEREAPMGALFTRGAALAYGWLDWAFAAQPGSTVLAMWALSATQTPAAAPGWRADPDVFDVLRESFKGALFTGSTADDLLLELAMARGTLAVDSPEAAPLGPLARARRDWIIDWPAKARALTLPTGLAPTGSSVLEVRCAGAPKGARLRMEATWEEHARMRWAMVKLDDAGRPVGRVLVPTTPKATSAQMSLVELDGVAAVLVVAANVGAWTEPFDPDDGVWERHGYVVTLAAE
jgi:hypothetical protein